MNLLWNELLTDIHSVCSGMVLHPSGITKYTDPMEYSRFEDYVQKMVPAFVLKPFNHLLRYIPDNLRQKFVHFLNHHKDLNRAFDWVVFQEGVQSRPLLEYAHQRMQDNMSEIMD